MNVEINKQGIQLELIQYYQIRTYSVLINKNLLSKLELFSIIKIRTNQYYQIRTIRYYQIRTYSV